jgi:hypothetical protein
MPETEANKSPTRIYEATTTAPVNIAVLSLLETMLKHFNR